MCTERALHQQWEIQPTNCNVGGSAEEPTCGQPQMPRYSGFRHMYLDTLAWYAQDWGPLTLEYSLLVLPFWG